MIDRLVFKQDYVGYLNHQRTHLYVHDLEAKTTIQITDRTKLRLAIMATAPPRMIAEMM